MKFLSKFFFPLLLLLASCFLLKKDKTKKQETAAEKPILQEQTDVSPAAIPRPKKDSIGSITISAVGDLMCHITQYTYAKTDDGKYDFNPSFAEVKNFLSEADFAIGNLETTTAGAALGYSGYPNFNSPDEYAEALKNAGFDLLVTSNNHSMDMGEKGLLRTIEVIKKNNLSYTGTYISQRDRDSLPAVGAMTLDEVERGMVQKALRHHAGNLTRAAEALGLSRAALYRRIEKYGLQA